MTPIVGAQTIDSSYQVGSSSTSSVEAITTDNSGNTYVAGYFKDSVWVNKIHLLKGYASIYTLYFVAYKPDGSLLFKKLISTGTRAPIQLETDDSGFVYLGSLYQSTKTYLDIENQKDAISSGYGQQAFILKLNSSGDHLWYAYSQGNKTKTNVETSEFAITGYGQIIWLCSAHGAMSVHTSTRYGYSGFGSIGNEQLNRTGSFLLRMDPNTTVRYPKTTIGNSDAIVRVTSLAEKDGNIYYGGQLNGTVDFDPSTNTKELTLSGKAFYCSLDTQMNLRWVKASTLHRFSKIRVNAYDQIMCYGSYAGVGEAKFEMSSVSTNGDVVWEYSEPFSNVSLQINDCQVDKGGNTFVCGTFAGSGDFDPTSNSRTGGASNNAAFLVKYDSSGEAKWLIVGSATGSYTNSGNTVHLAEDNQLYWGGVYSRTFNFSGNSSQNVPYTTKILGFVAQLTECQSLKPKIDPVDTSICKGASIDIRITGATSATWKDNSNTNLFRTISPEINSSYSVIVSNDSGCYKTLTSHVTVNSLPTPSITFNKNICSVVGTWSSYQWYFNGNKVVDETNSTYEPDQNGQVYCIVEDQNGCFGKSNELQFTLVSSSKLMHPVSKVYYYDNTLNFDLSNTIQHVTVRLYDVTGKNLSTSDIEISKGHGKIPISLSMSTYLVVISVDDIVLDRRRIVVY